MKMVKYMVKALQLIVLFLQIKGTQMQIRKSLYMFVFK